METFTALLALCEGNPPVTSGLPSQGPVMQSSNVFYVLLNKRLSKQSRCWWFETPWHSFWRHNSGLNRHADNTYFSNTLIISDGSVTTDICIHYGDVIMGEIASQVTSLTIVYSNFYSDADQRKHQSSASLAFVCGINRWPVNSPHNGPVTRKMFPFDDVIMWSWKPLTSNSTDSLRYRLNQVRKYWSLA